MKDAELEDYGVYEGDFSFRQYKITLKTRTSSPEAFIEFYLNSSSTSKIADKEYTYSYYYSNSGTFTSIKTAMNVEWENELSVGGIFYYENKLDQNYNNTITVTTEGDNKAFDIDLKYISNGDTVNVKAYYEGTLTQVN
ncbi:MAG: hypothetical protein IPO21_03485 [Bacteroidales bacterium]|nr:hypothetical protein [Bacteroidales bacterium]